MTNDTLYAQPADTGITPHFLPTTPRVPSLIGVSGWIRHGKDSVAAIIQDVYGHERAKFAAPLYRLAYEIDAFAAFPGSDKVRVKQIIDDLGWEEAKDHHPEVRRLLEAVGTKCREVIGQDVWVEALSNSIQDSKSYVISDVRFRNEARWIKDRGGIVIRVDRANIGDLSKHISQHDLDTWDFDGYVINDGTLEDLRYKVSYLMRLLG